VIVVYSLDDLSTLNKAIYWGEQVQNLDKATPLLFIGNKSDLRKTNETTISFETAKNLIHMKFPEAAIIECSCATAENIIRAGWILANLATKKWKDLHPNVAVDSNISPPSKAKTNSGSSCLVQ